CLDVDVSGETMETFISREFDVMKRRNSSWVLVNVVNLALLVCWTKGADGEESPAPTAPAVSPAEPSEPAVQLPGGVEDILKLTKNKVPDDITLAFIESSGLHFKLSAAHILELRNAGVSDQVLLAVLKQPSAPTEPAAASASPAWSPMPAYSAPQPDATVAPEPVYATAGYGPSYSYASYSYPSYASYSYPYCYGSYPCSSYPASYCYSAYPYSTYCYSSYPYCYSSYSYPCYYPYYGYGYSACSLGFSFGFGNGYYGCHNKSYHCGNSYHYGKGYYQGNSYQAKGSQGGYSAGANPAAVGGKTAGYTRVGPTQNYVGGNGAVSG